MKKQKLKVIVNLSSFEKVSESHENGLVGGFSQSISQLEPITIGDGGGESNNCQGGNCTRDCGNGQNIQCNTTSGCGN